MDNEWNITFNINKSQERMTLEDILHIIFCIVSKGVIIAEGIEHYCIAHGETMTAILFRPRTSSFLFS